MQFIIQNSIKKKNPFVDEGMKRQKKPGSDLLSRRRAAVPSARGRFTSVFGMGTGIAALLWPPGDHAEVYSHDHSGNRNDNMAKPHGALVPVG